MAIKLYQYIKHCIVTRSICRAMILFMTCKISSYHKWDRHLVMHIYEKWVSISSGSYLLPVQHQPTTWPSADIMSIGPLGMHLPKFSSSYLIAIIFWRESHLCIVNIKASEAKTFFGTSLFSSITTEWGITQFFLNSAKKLCLTSQSQNVLGAVPVLDTGYPFETHLELKSCEKIICA